MQLASIYCRWRTERGEGVGERYRPLHTTGTTFWETCWYNGDYAKKVFLLKQRLCRKKVQWIGNGQ